MPKVNTGREPCIFCNRPTARRILHEPSCGCCLRPEKLPANGGGLCVFRLNQGKKAKK